MIGSEMSSPPIAQHQTYTFAEIRSGLETQTRVIQALIMRETKTRYGEHKLGFLWAILEPGAMVVVFVAIFSAMRNDNPSGMPLAIFMLVGIAPFGLFRDTMQLLVNSLAANKSLLTFPQVTTYDVMAARALLEITTASGVFVLLLCIAHVIGFEFRVENPLGVLAACSLIAIMGVSAGITFATIKPLFPSIQQFIGVLLSRPLYIASGIFFTVDIVPEPMRTWLLYNPLLHMMELLRTEFFYEFESKYGSWTYATVWAFSFFTFSLMLHQALRKRVIVAI